MALINSKTHQSTKHNQVHGGIEKHSYENEVQELPYNNNVYPCITVHVLRYSMVCDGKLNFDFYRKYSHSLGARNI